MSAHAWSESVAKSFRSDDVITSDTYQSYSTTDWDLSKGGGQKGAGFNAKNHTNIGNAYGTAANASHAGFYIKSRNKLSNICKITFTYQYCSTASECNNAKIYIGYSTDGSSWSPVTLTSGSQGTSIAPSEWDGSAGSSSNETTWTFEFANIASAYFAIIVSRNGAMTAEKGFRFDDTDIDFYTGCCDYNVTPAKGTLNNCDIAFSPEEVATCSSTAADRQLTITLTPAACYAAPSADAVARASGIACTKVSGPTDNGDGTYNYVFQFAQNVTGTTTFNASVSAKQTYTISYNKGTYGTGSNTSATKTCGVNLALPGVTFTRTGYTQVGWSTSAAGSSKAYNLSGSYSTDAATTLYPYWEANTISITLDKNGGDANGSASVKYDATALTSRTDATRSEWNVVGYYAEPECTNKVLTNTGLLVDYTGYVESGKWVRAAATTLYAKWSKTQYTVTFNMNGHGSSVAAQNVESGDPAVEPATPSAEDWRFLGWYDAASGGSAWNFSTGITSNTTIHAHWEAIEYNTGTYKAWCEPEIDITGDIHLTSVKNIGVYSTSTTGNLLHIISDDLARVNKLEIKYLNADDSDAEVIKSSSLFRLCNDGTSNYNVADGSDIAVSGSCNLTYSIKYTPTEYNVVNHYKLQIVMKNNSSVLKTVTHDLYGRALPEEFAVVSKFGGEWYALPNTLEATESAAKAVAGIKITVDNSTTPTKVTYAPNTVVYKGENRYASGTNVYGVRLTDGTNHLQVSSTSSKNTMWLSPTGSSTNQDWYLNSTDFGAYTLTIPSVGSKKLGIYGGYIGYYSSPTSPSEQIYLLPIENKLSLRDATVKEWGEHGVIVEADMTDVASATMNVGAADPTDATLTAVNGTLGSTKNVRVYAAGVTVGAVANDGKQLYIHWKDANGDEIAASQVEIPCVIADNANMNALNNKGGWATKEVHILPGKTLTANAGSFAGSAVTVPTIYIYPGATLDVTTGTLTATTLRLRNGWTRANETTYDVARVHIADNAALVKTTASIDYDLYNSAEGNHYYPFAVPFETEVSAIDYADAALASKSTYGTHYGIDEYDGAARAIGGNSADNWARVASDATLQPGKGYTIVALPVKGEAIIRVPLTYNNGWTADGELATYDGTTKNVIAVSSHTGEAATSNKRNAGWNMLGVPFMSCYEGSNGMYDGGAELINGALVVTPGNADPYSYSSATVPYVSVPSHDFAEYIQTDITEAKLLPGWSFFVQVGTTGNVTFLTNKQTTNMGDQPYYAPQRTTSEAVVRTGIILSSDQASDKTTFLISDQYSAEYEIGADLEKMFGEGYTLATYSLSGDTRLAFNAMSATDAKQVIPIGFRAPADGEYTFSLNPQYTSATVERMDLIDYQTGTLTDLMNADYTFTTTRTQDDSRFALNIVQVNKVATGNDVLHTDGNDAYKVLLNGTMYIIRDKKMYDATGKRVYEINK